MADDTNIDEILKSIDALLKEGGPENESDEGAAAQSSITRSDIATNDDDVSLPQTPDAPIAIEDAEDEAGPPDLEVMDQVSAEQSEAEEAETYERPESDAQTEDGQAEDASESDIQSGQTLEHGHEVKRIVLSESMVVEDTPDLPLEVAGVDTAIAGDQLEDRAPGELSDQPGAEYIAPDDLNEGEADEVGECEDTGSAELAENEEKGQLAVDTPELDMNQLVEQITAEISTRLQQQLPGMVAGMVAEALQKNLSARTDTDHESTDDTQN